jgi:hypothetical protein
MVREELRALGLRFSIETTGRNHMVIRWLHGDHERELSIPTSPSDVRARWNDRAKLRRILRADGYDIGGKLR